MADRLPEEVAVMFACPSEDQLKEVPSQRIVKQPLLHLEQIYVHECFSKPGANSNRKAAIQLARKACREASDEAARAELTTWFEGWLSEHEERYLETGEAVRSRLLGEPTLKSVLPHIWKFTASEAMGITDLHDIYELIRNLEKMQEVSRGKSVRIWGWTDFPMLNGQVGTVENYGRKNHWLVKFDDGTKQEVPTKNLVAADASQQEFEEALAAVVALHSNPASIRSYEPQPTPVSSEDVARIKQEFQDHKDAFDWTVRDDVLKLNAVRAWVREQVACLTDDDLIEVRSKWSSTLRAINDKIREVGRPMSTPELLRILGLELSHGNQSNTDELIRDEKYKILNDRDEKSGEAADAYLAAVETTYTMEALRKLATLQDFGSIYPELAKAFERLPGKAESLVEQLKSHRETLKSSKNSCESELSTAKNEMVLGRSALRRLFKEVLEVSHKLKDTTIRFEHLMKQNIVLADKVIETELSLEVAQAAAEEVTESCKNQVATIASTKTEVEEFFESVAKESCQEMTSLPLLMEATAEAQVLAEYRKTYTDNAQAKLGEAIRKTKEDIESIRQEVNNAWDDDRPRKLQDRLAKQKATLEGLQSKTESFQKTLEKSASVRADVSKAVTYSPDLQAQFNLAATTGREAAESYYSSFPPQFWMGGSESSEEQRYRELAIRQAEQQMALASFDNAGIVIGHMECDLESVTRNYWELARDHLLLQDQFRLFKQERAGGGDQDAIVLSKQQLEEIIETKVETRLQQEREDRRMFEHHRLQAAMASGSQQSPPARQVNSGAATAAAAAATTTTAMGTIGQVEPISESTIEDDDWTALDRFGEEEP